ncbi:MAG: Gfo/Idh/MocA family oxidoreductase [Atribacterota bacterium]|nr:Gfo/Idh/MocA family oxidoreductase [Atribacterota bacterium]
MKTNKLLIFIITICSIITACNKKGVTNENRVIKVATPQRAEGQSDVIQLSTEPIPTVRIAIIGLGGRGEAAVYRLRQVPGAEIVALCDIVEDRVKKANKELVENGKPKAKEFYGDSSAWRQVTTLPDVDLVYIVTDWENHAKMGIQAMKDNKHVAIEVPAALTLDEIWGLVDTSEKTRKHCMQLENCIYDFFELTTLNMVQQGLLGEIVHGEGAYIHELKTGWIGPDSRTKWRFDYNRKHRGDVYPTHGLGPICMAMNIHRGDRMNYLVSVDSKQISIIDYAKNKTGEDISDFKNGEHTSTLIRTEKGKSILVEHNVTSPRPYDRMYQLTGTKGFANKFPVEGYALFSENLDPSLTKGHDSFTPHEFVPEDIKKAMLEKYKHPIIRELEEKAKEVGGHGGMDFIMDYRLIYCLQNGLHLDMDVYDLAEWCSLIPLTEISLENNSSPVEIPDFTRGAWNKLNQVEFAGVMK